MEDVADTMDGEEGIGASATSESERRVEGVAAGPTEGDEATVPIRAFAPPRANSTRELTSRVVAASADARGSAMTGRSASMPRRFVASAEVPGARGADSAICHVTKCDGVRAD